MNNAFLDYSFNHVILILFIYKNMVSLYRMTPIAAIILGFIEGATEFIPVSSSGHLIIVRNILGQDGGGLAFDAVLQLATSCALLVYFWKDIVRLLQTAWGIVRKQNVLQKERTLLYAILLGTIPAIIFGLVLEGSMETVFRNAKLVAMMLILGSLLMYSAQWYSKKVLKIPNTSFGEKNVSISKGVMIGFFQCFALVPGVSRSGATISGGLFAGLSQEEATRFSFLLSLPILFGAGLKKLFDVRHELFLPGFGTPLLFGSITAFVVGLASIGFLLRYLKTHNLNIFILYRVIVAVVLLLWL
jgi:undecaprenyl-diphosphatase